MNNWTLKIAGALVVVFTILYLTVFFGGFGFYIFASIPLLFQVSTEGFQALLWAGFVGLSISLLASLMTWPFALSTATLLEHNRDRRWIHRTQQLLSFFASMPLILFIYVYIEVVGERGFQSIEFFWRETFASTNILTQTIAFALTLLLYPLTIIPGLSSAKTVDHFYQECLLAVFEFAEVGLMTTVVVIGLFLYVFPKMVLHMCRLIKSRENQNSLEVIQSIGGTSWESIHLTVLQSMKLNFNSVLALFTRICFFEGLITYTLIHFFLNSSLTNFFWGQTLSALFLGHSRRGDDVRPLLLTAGLLALCYFFYYLLERKVHRREARYV